MLAACSFGAPDPAPVILRGDGAGPGWAAAAPAAVPAAPATRTVVVGRGQSLSVIARDYRVPERAIIAANHLTPPYRIEIGRRLVIPGAGEPPMRPMLAARAPAPSAPMLANRAPAPSAPGRPPPDVIPLDGPAPAAAAAAEERPARPPAPMPPAAAMAAKPPAATAPPMPPVAATAPKPPLAAMAAKPPPAPRTAAPARPDPAAAPAAAPATAADAGATHAGRFPWPVRGRILAAYGVSAGGNRNDGINIAAPRGTPIDAIAGGVVAYAGNELPGYGNLVLVKHPDGWISAYAHCAQLLVKQGDKVSRGEVIAKVGATGGVSEPQLHFELRRGKRAVDPREFLAPSPTAGAAETARPG